MDTAYAESLNKTHAAKPRMHTAAIVRRLDAGTATNRDRRVYVARVQRAGMWQVGPACRYGHYECAAFKGGPCMGEVLSELPEEDRL